MGGDELTTAQIGAIRQVVKEEIEEHYGRIARGAIGWIVGAVASVIVGAFVLGSWVTQLNARVDTAEKIFVTEILSIKTSLDEIKTEVKELRK